MSRTARVIVCLLAVGLLAWRLNWAELWGVWARAYKPLVIVAVLMLGPSLLLLALRMVMLVRACGSHLAFRRSLLILLVGNWTSSILPAGTITGDGVRLVLLAQGTGSRHVALVVVAADRLLGLAGLLCFPIVFAVWHPPVPGYGRISSIILAVGLGCAALVCAWQACIRLTPLAPARLCVHAKELGRSASLLWGRPRTLGAGLAISVLSHGLILASLLLAARALGGFNLVSVQTVAAFMCLTALSLLASTLPFGVMEWCFAGLLGWQSGIMSPEVAVSVALFGRAAQVMYGLPAALWLLWKGPIATEARDLSGAAPCITE